MQTNFRGRDFIGDLDFTKEEVETVLEVAWDLKRKRALGEPHPYLRDKVLAMLFFFSSTRTRGSFEAGMAQLGAIVLGPVHAVFIRLLGPKAAVEAVRADFDRLAQGVRPQVSP